MESLYYLDLFGTLVFAISGVITALDKKFDLVGSIIIGLITAVGGGSLRDLLIGSTPVGWMKDEYYLIAILLGVVLSYALKTWIIRLKRSMFFIRHLRNRCLHYSWTSKNPGYRAQHSSRPFDGGGIRSIWWGYQRCPLQRSTLDIQTPDLRLGLFWPAVWSFVLGIQASLPPIWISLFSIAIVVGIRYLSVRHNWSLTILR